MIEEVFLLLFWIWFPTHTSQNFDSTQQVAPCFLFSLQLYLVHTGLITKYCVCTGLYIFSAPFFSQKALAVAWKICRKKVTVKNGISVSPLRTWRTSTFLKQFIAELLISPEMNLCKSKVFHLHAFAFKMTNSIPMMQSLSRNNFQHHIY